MTGGTGPAVTAPSPAVVPQRLPPRSRAVSALLTALVALGALSTDMYLPMLPAITGELATSPAATQLTLSVFIFGVAVGQLVYGPLSDRFGRRPLLIGGLGLYVLGSLACALAPSIEALIAFRFVQAVGACAGPVLGRAVVRDVYPKERAATVLAYMASAMAVVPAVAPIFGGWFGTLAGWRPMFALMAALGIGMLIVLWRILGETNHSPRADALRPAVIVATYRRILDHRGFLGFMLANALMFSGMFAYISGASFVLIDTVGVAAENFGFCFAAVVAGYIAGSQIAGRLSRRLGIDRLVRIGAALGAGTGALLLGLHLGFGPSVLTIVPAMSLYFGAAGLVMPAAFAGALSPFPAAAGSAAALAGFVQMLTAGLAGAAVGAFLAAGSIAMPAVIAAMGAAALAAVGALRPRS